MYTSETFLVSLLFDMFLHSYALFSLPVQMYWKSYCTTPSFGGSDSFSKILKVLSVSFYVIGKALTGELSCRGPGLFKK